MKKLNTTSTYLPSIDIHLRRFWKRNVPLYNNKFSYKIFGDDAFFNHAALLDNAYYCIKDKVYNYRDTYNVPNETVLFVDSGGFQISSRYKKNLNIDINPSMILDWIEHNADVGMNLDIPPSDNFNDSLKRSYNNFEFFENNRTYDAKLYNILHGSNSHQMEIWYNKVKDFSFDGWAIGVKPPTNPVLQIESILLLHSNDAYNMGNGVHYFGMSSLSNIMINAVLSRELGIPITFDSSSHTIGSRSRMYLYPNIINGSIDLGIKSNHKISDIGCGCPVCKHLVSMDDLYDINNVRSYTPILLDLHNIYQYIIVNNMINWMAADRDVLMRYAKIFNQDGPITLLYNMLDDYNSNGYRYVETKYHVDGHPDAPVKHNSVFSFDPIT